MGQPAFGAAKFQTCFGELSVTLHGRLPEMLAAACVGRLLDGVALHPLTANRGWRVSAADVSDDATTVTVETGSVPCRFEAEATS